MCVEPFDEDRFLKYFEKLYKKLYAMESIKYLPPKFSRCFKELADTLGVETEMVEDPLHMRHDSIVSPRNEPSNSSNTSIVSFLLRECFLNRQYRT